MNHPAESIDCQVCRSDASPRIVFHKWGYPILECTSCGLRSCARVSQKEIESIYSKDYFEGGRRASYQSYRASEPVFRKEFSALAKRLHQQVGGGTLLEVGAAYGFFLSEAAAYFNVEGVELSVDAARHAAGLGLRVHVGDILTVKPDRTHYDVIVLLDCIEHVPHPRAVLERLCTFLRPGGTLLMTTGDAGSWAARLFGKYWRLITPPQHLFFFSAAGMSRLLGDLGFEAIKTQRFWRRVPLGLVVFQLLSRLGWRYQRADWLNGIGIPVYFFDGMRVSAQRRLA